MPSPHFDEQLPVAQSGSNVQPAEQPSPSTTFESSQASAPSFRPSPQTVRWDCDGCMGFGTIGGALQTKPGSNLQAAEHPCPTLGGSHSSVPVSTPSPQWGTQNWPGRGQSHPFSSAHMAEQ